MIADEMRAVINGTPIRPATPHAAPVGSAGPLDPNPARWVAVFGGATNVAALDAVAGTRLRVVVRDPAAVDRQRLSELNVAWVSNDTFHITCGDAAPRYAQVISDTLSEIGGGALPA